MIEPHRNGSLRIAVAIALVGGAVGSVGLMLIAGRTAPRLLQVLFTFWVMSPFVVLAAAEVLSRRWSTLTRATLQVVTLVVAVASLSIYAYVALGPPRERVAPPFVLTPPLSWLVIAIAVLTAAWISRERRR